MSLHLLGIRRNVNRNVFNDRKNVSATTCPVTNTPTDAMFLRPPLQAPAVIFVLRGFSNRTRIGSNVFTSQCVAQCVQCLPPGLKQIQLPYLGR